MINVDFNFKGQLPAYKLSYVDNFYMYCEMEDRTIIIQRVDEANLQFDTKYKKTGNCASYTKSLDFSVYNCLKAANFELDSIRAVIERELENCLFNHISEDLVKVVNEMFGSYSYLSWFKTSSSFTVENHVHYFTMGTMRYPSKDAPVPETYTQIFLFDSLKKQVYIQRDVMSNKFSNALTGTRFTSCKTEVYDSLTTDCFKVDVDNGLMGSIICYSNNHLHIYDNTFGEITHYEGDHAFISDKIFEFVKDLVKHEPADLMKQYVKEYDIELNGLTTDQLNAVIMADY